MRGSRLFKRQILPQRDPMEVDRIPVNVRMRLEAAFINAMG